MVQGLVVLTDEGGHVVKVDAADCGIVFRLRGVFIFQLGPMLEKRHDALKGDRLSVVIALDPGTADFPQKLHLFGSLHALAHGLHAEADGHFHELREDDLAVVPLVETAHKAHIEFDEVKVDLLEDVHGGIAAAEIVHPYREAQLPEAGDLLLHEVEIRADHTLRDLDGDHGTVDARLVHAAANLFHHIAALKVHAGEVDGLGHHVKACLPLELHFLQYPFQHIEIQLVDKLVLLQRRDEMFR